jgi:hypothetical protein
MIEERRKKKEQRERRKEFSKYAGSKASMV